MASPAEEASSSTTSASQSRRDRVRQWVAEMTQAELARLKDHGQRVIPVPVRNMGILREDEASTSNSVQSGKDGQDSIVEDVSVSLDMDATGDDDHSPPATCRSSDANPETSSKAGHQKDTPSSAADDTAADDAALSTQLEKLDVNDINDGEGKTKDATASKDAPSKPSAHTTTKVATNTSKQKRKKNKNKAKRARQAAKPATSATYRLWNRLELRTSFDFERVREIMHDNPVACPTAPHMHYVNVVLITDTPMPLVVPYVYDAEKFPENSLQDWMFINDAGQRVRHHVNTFA